MYNTLSIERKDDMDIKSKAQKLAEALTTSQEYQRYQKSREEINNHEAAKVMLRDFQKKQTALQKQQMEGNPVTEQQMDDLRKLSEVLTINPYIRELVEAEMAFGSLMMEVQEILTNSLDVVPLGEDDDEETSEAEVETNETASGSGKKLWVPGD